MRSMLLLVHVHARSGFGMIDTIDRIVEKRIDWKQRNRSIIVATRLRQRSPR